jgi:CRP-like cAMP-binding protein
MLKKISDTSHHYFSHPLFAGNLDPWHKISASLHPKNIQRLESVVLHGDSADALWLVYRGWVKLTRQTPDGKEAVVGLCTEGDVFGEAALFTGASYPYTAEIISPEAELLAIPAISLRSIISEDPSISRHIMAIMNERTTQTQLKLEHMSTMSAAQRLGCFLLRLCHQQADGSKMLHIPVEKNILATYLGMKPETLSRSQQQLKTLGIQVAGADVAVADIARLRQFVCESCSESGSCDAEDAAS